MSDPLDKFIVNEDERPDIDLLVSIVDGYFRFTKNGHMLFEKNFHKLSESKKIMIFLLGRKIIKIKNLVPDFKEEIKPKEISDITGIKRKNVTSRLSTELSGITKSLTGAHYIPNYNLYKCEELMKVDDSKRSN